MNKRTYIIISILGIFSLGIIWRLSFLQLQENRYKKWARLNALLKESVEPERGLIYDRKGRLLVSNQPIYSVYVTPSETKAFDTLALADLLDISPEELKRSLIKAKKYSLYKASQVSGQYLKEEIAPLKATLFNYPGFSIRKRHIRKYFTQHAANVLGYLQEVSPSLIKKDSFYEPGDLVGAAGIEKYYEKILRGQKGYRYFYRDKLNRKTKPYENGSFDLAPVPGKNLKLTIDIELQAFIDSLMINKHGAVVAIEPGTGEILALVSAPSYNPSLLSGRKRNQVIKRLLGDKLHKPMYDRSLLGTYPPGSPFKLLEALIGLQEGVINRHTGYKCNHGFKYGNRFMHCHCGANGRIVHLRYALPHSCNTYFSQTYLRILDKPGSAQKGINRWAGYLKNFGLGDYLHYDLPVGRKGLVPDSAYYHRYFGHDRWKSMNTISNGIGQGQVLVTPIQMANVMAAIANRGFYYTPHILKSVDNHPPEYRFRIKHFTGIDSVHFQPVIQGMLDVYRTGTAKYSQIPGINIGGKTGTAENFTRINGKRIKLPDHSIFVAMAPVEKPKIVVSVFIENGGFGATLAAPIASLIIEKYLKGKITRQDLLDKVLQANLNKIYELKTYGPQKKN